MVNTPVAGQLRALAVRGAENSLIHLHMVSQCGVLLGLLSHRFIPFGWV